MQCNNDIVLAVGKKTRSRGDDDMTLTYEQLLKLTLVLGEEHISTRF
jgi:hypothetical protein